MHNHDYDIHKIKLIVLNSILSQNGLNKDEFDIESCFRDNGIESIDMVETLVDIEDELNLQGYDVELNYYELDVHEDNFHTLVELVRNKL